MQLLNSSTLKFLRCSVWLICVEHVPADGIHSLTISSSFLNYFYVSHTWLGSQPVFFSDLSLENSGVSHSSIHLIFHLTKEFTFAMMQMQPTYICA